MTGNPTMLSVCQSWVRFPVPTSLLFPDFLGHYDVAVCRATKSRCILNIDDRNVYVIIVCNYVNLPLLTLCDF